jgi:DNA polymerase-3 subunit epsilon
MRAALDVCGCFPTGRHYPGIAARLERVALQVEGLAPFADAAARWAEQKLVVIDFETTGLDPTKDRIIEIGVACFEAGQLSGFENWIVNPGIEVPAESLEITKIDPAEIAAAPTLPQVLEKFAARIEGHVPVAYNAGFDQGFLLNELNRYDWPVQRSEARAALDPNVTWIDPLVWVRELHKEERGHRLTEVCARLGIPLDNAHRAASDAEASGRVLLALAPRLPELYSELIRIQTQYAARQDVDMAINFRRRG